MSWSDSRNGSPAYQWMEGVVSDSLCLENVGGQVVSLGFVSWGFSSVPFGTPLCVVAARAVFEADL